MALCHVVQYTSKALRYGPYVIRGSHSLTYQATTHTLTIPAFTPQPQGVTALCMVLIAPTHERDSQAELAWVAGYIYRDKCPAPGVEPGHSHPSHR